MTFIQGIGISQICCCFLVKMSTISPWQDLGMNTQFPTPCFPTVFTRSHQESASDGWISPWKPHSNRRELSTTKLFNHITTNSCTLESLRRWVRVCCCRSLSDACILSERERTRDVDSSQAFQYWIAPAFPTEAWLVHNSISYCKRVAEIHQERLRVSVRPIFAVWVQLWRLLLLAASLLLQLRCG